MFAQLVAASCSRGDFGWVYVEADVFYLRPQLQPTAQGGKLSYFILEREETKTLLQRGAEKDPGFDRYWLAVACQQVASFPDEIERWGVQMIVPVSAVAVKSRLLELGDRIMDELNQAD